MYKVPIGKLICRYSQDQSLKVTHLHTLTNRKTAQSSQATLTANGVPHVL